MKMANTAGNKRKHKDSQKNKRERRRAVMDMLAISKAVYMLSDSYLYQIQTPSEILRNMSTEDINKKNKQWLKKVKPKSHMTKKEYRRWKNKMKRLGVA